MDLKLSIDDEAGAYYARRYGYTDTITDGKGETTANPESVADFLMRFIPENIASEAQQREAYEAGKAAEKVVLDRPRRPVIGEKAEAAISIEPEKR